MHKEFIFFFLLIALSTGIPERASAGLFGEHKYIGDEAFREFTNDNKLDSFFIHFLGMKVYGKDLPVLFTHNPYARDSYSGIYSLFDNKNTNGISYGDLTGLSGDHSIDPVQLFRALVSDSLFNNTNNTVSFGSLEKKLEDVLNAHHVAIDNGFKEADNLGDLDYIFLALEDKSHFYDAGLSMRDQLNYVNADVIKALRDYIDALNKDHIREDLVQLLFRSNAIAKYAVLHLLALDQIKQAAVDFPDIRFRPFAIHKIKKAFLYNSFADHYLQDAFAAGHLPVKRSILNAFNNNGTHDYYNRVGLNVTNKNGRTWTAYGDSYYDSVTYKFAIEANVASLNELWIVFRGTVDQHNNSDSVPMSLMDSLIEGKISESPSEYLETRFTAFSLIPVPFTKDQLKHDLKFAHSRNGFFYEAAFGIFLNDHIEFNANKLSIAAGWGRHKKKPPQTGNDKALEFLLWRSYSFVYSRSNTKAKSWNEYKINIEDIACDKFAVDVAGGIKRVSNTSYFIVAPAAGFELKPVSWSLAPSIKAAVAYSPHFRPEYMLQATLRFY